MKWMWFAVADGVDIGDAVAAAPATWPDGTPACVLAAWPADHRPKVRAAKIDARMILPDGPAAPISLVLTPPRIHLPFDDTAVQQARRDVIASRPPAAISTLLRGDSLFAGAVTVDPSGDDPFARIFPARRLLVGCGLFGPVPAPAGPDIERHGSGAPWPVPDFAASVT